MVEIKGSGATEAEQAGGADGTPFIKPESALVRAALDLMASHTAEGEAGDGDLCAHCGMSYPCPTVLHARQVVDAGGLERAVAA
jgi:hypothetical protein